MALAAGTGPNPIAGDGAADVARDSGGAVTRQICAMAEAELTIDAGGDEADRLLVALDAQHNIPPLLLAFFAAVLNHIVTFESGRISSRGHTQ